MKTSVLLISTLSFLCAGVCFANIQSSFDASQNKSIEIYTGGDANPAMNKSDADLFLELFSAFRWSVQPDSLKIPPMANNIADNILAMPINSSIHHFKNITFYDLQAGENMSCADAIIERTPEGNYLGLQVDEKVTVSVQNCDIAGLISVGVGGPIRPIYPPSLIFKH